MIYALKNANGVHGWVGKNIHKALADAIKNRVAFRELNRPAERVATGLLTDMMKQAVASARGDWKEEPKQKPALLAHIGGEKVGKVAWGQAQDTVRAAMNGFFESEWWEWLKRLPPGATKTEELHACTVEGVTVWVTVDCEVVPAPETRPRRSLIDFKTGKRMKVEHQTQIVLYSLARDQGRDPGKEARLLIYNPVTGAEWKGMASDDDHDRMKIRILSDTKAIAKYLVDGDIEKNEPMPEAEWPMTADERICKWCEFKGVCPKWTRGD
jgi:hypothetical protein